MRTSSETGRKFSAADRTDSVERLAAFLTAMHPQKTAANVSADTGVNADTVQKWLEKGCAPSWTAALALFLAYGAEALCAAYGKDAPAWLTTAGQDAELARIDADLAALKAQRDALLNR